MDAPTYIELFFPHGRRWKHQLGWAGSRPARSQHWEPGTPRVSPTSSSPTYPLISLPNLADHRAEQYFRGQFSDMASWPYHTHVIQLVIYDIQIQNIAMWCTGADTHEGRPSSSVYRIKIFGICTLNSDWRIGVPPPGCLGLQTHTSCAHKTAKLLKL